MLAQLTLQELKQKPQSSYQIIDIRTPYEYASGHFPNAKNIPYDVLVMYPDSYLKRNETYYLICAHGSLSHRASAILQSYGYKVANIKNGYSIDMRFLEARDWTLEVGERCFLIPYF